MIFIDYILDDCKNKENIYNEICIRCNKCGRFDERTIPLKKGKYEMIDYE